MIKIHIRPALKEEHPYAYSRDEGDICIGHLRADFGRSGTEFWSTWTDHDADQKTQEFKDIFDDVINRLRENEVISPLKSRTKMSHFCYDYSEAAEDGSCGRSYIFRVDAGGYSFIMRMNPNPGFYNLYCYCYDTEKLNGGVAG